MNKLNTTEVAIYFVFNMLFFIAAGSFCLSKLQGIKSLLWIAGSLFSLLFFMAFFPNPELPLSENPSWLDLMLLFIRSCYEEIFKITLCLVFFSGSSRRELVYFVLLFSLGLSVIENLSQFLTIYVAVAEEIVRTIYFSKYVPSVSIKEVVEYYGVAGYPAIIFFQLLRFPIHFYLTWWGITLIRKKNYFQVIFPLCAHGFLNLIYAKIQFWQTEIQMRAVWLTVISLAAVILMGRILMTSVHKFTNDIRS